MANPESQEPQFNISDQTHEGSPITSSLRADYHSRTLEVATPQPEAQESDEERWEGPTY
ncbi:MAG: hypothetical protein AAB836_01205 [Patescibacteria group bacterium]